MEQKLGSDISLLNKTNRALLENSGKQLRPILCLLSAMAAGGKDPNEASVHFAAASELLHNATLLHDDVVDDSPLRRGKPTVMSLLGSRPSVLIGDYWLVKALECVLDAPDADVHRVIRLFSDTLTCLASGEMLQMQMAFSGKTGEAEYLRIIHDKTVSLFETAALSGAISLAATPAASEAVVEYARCLGLAFQIQDDILDYVGGEQLGKPVGSDLMEQKITLPLLGAFVGAGDKEMEEQIRRKVVDIAAHPEYRDEILAFVKEHSGIAYAQRRMQEYLGYAREALSPLPETEAKGWMLRLADYLQTREY